MLSLWRDFDRFGMPSLLGWDPSRLFDNFPSYGAKPVAVKHEQDHVLIAADMPGVDPKDVDVTLENGQLSVVGQRGDTQYRFAIRLGNEYDGDTIQAELDKGVLTIKAQIRPEAKPRKIALKSVDTRSLASGPSS